MTRTKVKIAFMQNEGSRRLAFKNRKQGLFKKMHELTTLCQVEGCIIVYDPNRSDPEIWPSRTAAMSIIQMYNNMSTFEKNRKKEDQESMAKKELAKTQEEKAKLEKENKLIELNIAVHQYFGNNRAYFQNLPLDYLTYLSNHVLQPMLEELEARIPMFNPNV